MHNFVLKSFSLGLGPIPYPIQKIHAENYYFKHSDWLVKIVQPNGALKTSVP